MPQTATIKTTRSSTGLKPSPDDWFDQGAADHAVRFFEEYLVHTKGQWAGRPFTLLPWQCDDIIRPLFGWKRANGTRKYRTAYIEVPKKNGKSSMASGIGLYLLGSDGEAGAEIYSAAGDRDQAAIVFDGAKTMVEVSAPLRKRTQVYRRSIVWPRTRSFYKVLSADAPTKHGFNAHGVIFDELHVQPTRDLWDTLITGTAARRQPLVFATTTAGLDQLSICYEMHRYAQQILDGTLEDPSFFAYIAKADETDDWQDPAVWRKANPGYGVTVTEDYLAQEARRAAQMPAYQNTFRRLHLNQWVSQVTRWIDLRLWDAQAGTVDEETLRGRPCFGGFDMADSKDLVAWVLVFPHPQDPELLEVRCRFWCPEARLTADDNRYRDHYQAWKREGLLQTTPGAAIDYGFIKKQIMNDASTFDIVEFGFDRWHTHQLVQELEHEGLRPVATGMGFQGMAEPMREVERLLLLEKIRHGGHKVLRWMADNVRVLQDPAGNVKPDKKESQGKIDGIPALAMGIGRRMLHQPSIYERRGLITTG